MIILIIVLVTLPIHIIALVLALKWNAAKRKCQSLEAQLKEVQAQLLRKESGKLQNKMEEIQRLKAELDEVHTQKNTQKSELKRLTTANETLSQNQQAMVTDLQQLAGLTAAIADRYCQ